MTPLVARVASIQHPLSDALSTWPEDRREVYENRAAIMIHDGGLDPAEAHQRSEDCVRRRFAQQARNEDTTPNLKTLAEKVLAHGSTQQAGNASPTPSGDKPQSPDLKILPRPDMLACDFCGSTITTLFQVGVGCIQKRWHCPRCRREAERWAGYRGPSVRGI